MVKKYILSLHQRVKRVIFTLIEIYLYFLVPFSLAMYFMSLILNQRYLMFQIIIGFVISSLIIYHFCLFPVNDYKSLMRKTRNYIVKGNNRKAEHILTLFINNNKTNDIERSEIIYQIIKINIQMNKTEKAEFYIQELLNMKIDEFRKGDKLFKVGVCCVYENKITSGIYYLDKSFEILFRYIDKVHIHPRLLLAIVKAYISLNQINKAQTLYNTLLDNKKIKKVKKIEMLLKLR